MSVFLDVELNGDIADSGRRKKKTDSVTGNRTETKIVIILFISVNCTI